MVYIAGIMLPGRDGVKSMVPATEIPTQPMRLAVLVVEEDKYNCVRRRRFLKK